MGGCCSSNNKVAPLTEDVVRDIVNDAVSRIGRKIHASRLMITSDAHMREVRWFDEEDCSDEQPGDGVEE
ncbi:hypothetical protein FOA52_014738 [Chlamydomonas sp. UWO 241]|nr:hypothetical protein FOA52_014738 [Chlamydomonas sp. UWO 241]